MRMIPLIAAVALIGVPVALAKPPHPTPAHGHSATTTTTTAPTTTSASPRGQSAKVLFVLRGTLGAYTAATSTTNGTIAITVTGSNHESSVLKGSTLTVPVSSATKVVGTITSGHHGVVKLRAPKNTDAATLQAVTAFQLIDQGSSAS